MSDDASNGKPGGTILVVDDLASNLDLLQRLLSAQGYSVLTARDGVTDRVTGLREGADDYLPKPFAMEELVARLQALLRRPGNLLGRLLTFGNVSLDTDGRQVFVAGTPRSFPARETAVLEILLRRGGNVAPKRLFEDHLFGLSGGWDFPGNIRMRAGIDNLFDADPRVVGATPDNNALITTNTGRYDPLGRRGFVALQVDF